MSRSHSSRRRRGPTTPWAAPTGPESALPPMLEVARERTTHHGQRLICYTPTQYCNFDPVQLELGVKGCTAALSNMCVEQDGGVIPGQWFYQQGGNLLRGPWGGIW